MVSMKQAAPAKAEPSPVVELRELHKSFGALEVLKGISFTAREGQVVSLIGSSGSGKSTLLRCINMLEIPDSGDVLIDGEAIVLKGNGQGRSIGDEHQIRRIRSELGMVFQSFNLWAHMTILENVMEAPLVVQKRARPEVEDEARAMLDKVGIGAKADAYPAQLSGGQQQRAAEQCGPQRQTVGGRRAESVHLQTSCKRQALAAASRATPDRMAITPLAPSHSASSPTLLPSSSSTPIRVLLTAV